MRENMQVFTVFRDVIPCGFTVIYRRFARICDLRNISVFLTDATQSQTTTHTATRTSNLRGYK